MDATSIDAAEALIHALLAEIVNDEAYYVQDRLPGIIEASDLPSAEKAELLDILQATIREHVARKQWSDDGSNPNVLR